MYNFYYWSIHFILFMLHTLFIAFGPLFEWFLSYLQNPLLNMWILCCFADGCGLDRWGSPSPSLEGFFCKLRLHHCPGRLTTPSVHGAPGGSGVMSTSRCPWGRMQPSGGQENLALCPCRPPRVESQPQEGPGASRRPTPRLGPELCCRQTQLSFLGEFWGVFSPFPCSSYKTDDTVTQCRVYPWSAQPN